MVVMLILVKQMQLEEDPEGAARLKLPILKTQALQLQKLKMQH